MIAVGVLASVRAVCGEAGAFCVVARASPADWLQDACRDEVAKISLGLLEAESFGVLVAQPPGAPGHRDVVQRGDHAFV